MRKKWLMMFIILMCIVNTLPMDWMQDYVIKANAMEKTDFVSKAMVATALGQLDDLEEKDKAVTREELAVAMTQYLKKYGYRPGTTAMKSFYYDDFAEIANCAKADVTFVSKYSLMHGLKSGNKIIFSPKRNVTSAELTKCLTTLDEFIKREQTLKNNTQFILSKMSTEEKIGQILLLNFRTWNQDEHGQPIALETYNQDIGDIIKKYHLGNIILFGENTKNTEKTVRLINALQNTAISSGNLPLLIGIDQEGGTVVRLGQGTCLPGNMSLGASHKVNNAYSTGKIIGEELAAIGVNCNFAPDCDVNDNPKNPVIHLRSFSSNPIVVSKMAEGTIRGMKESNIIATAKHFPGHGNTNVDTHFGLAIVKKSKAEWEAIEAIPFKSVIDKNIDMIMSAHIQYPNLDNTQYVSKMTGEKIYLPATLSKKILTGILREELGFNGVIVTDAMDMNAITNNFGETEAIIMALHAGADLLCNPTAINCKDDVKKLAQIYREIKESLQDGRLSQARLDEAAGKVIELKLKYGILNENQYKENIEKKVQQAARIVGSKDHHSQERAIANDAITLYSDKTYRPFKPEKNENILFVVPIANEKNSVHYAMKRLIREGVIPNVNTLIYCYNNEKEITSTLKKHIHDADYVVMISELTAAVLNHPDHWQVKTPILILQEIKKANKEGHHAVISTGLPYDAVNYHNIPVYLAYGYQAMSENDAETGMITEKYGANLPAAIDCLMGAFVPKGELPINLLDH